MHQFTLVVDESHLEIDAVGFRKVPRGRGFLRAEDLCNCEGTFERPDHYLFVELWRGRKVCSLVVVIFNLKGRRAAFGVAADQGGRLEFSELVPSQRCAVALQNARLHRKNVPAALAPKRERQVVEMGVYVDLRAELKGQLFGFGKNLYRLCCELDAAEGPFPLRIFRTRFDFALDRNYPLRTQIFRDLKRLRRFGRNDDLNGAASVAHIKKDEFAVVAPHLDAAGHGHALPYGAWQFFVQRSFHTMFGS